MRSQFPLSTIRHILLATAVASILPVACAEAQVSAANSFYVPQIGPVAGPTEGLTAARFFVMCPNNDVSTTLTNDARIKIVVQDAGGAPIAGIPAANICIQLNGGTSAQGFSGAGGDSTIANSTWNVAPSCPNVRCIPADAPTNALGVTYITLVGSTPGFPGEATRDPSRKWGHFDSELPVLVLGVPLLGRLTSGSANGTYTLRVKNLDVVDGLDATFDDGEYVSYRDFNVMLHEFSASSPLTYWLDFNSSGALDASDLSLMTAHLRHDCATPNNP